MSTLAYLKSIEARIDAIQNCGSLEIASLDIGDELSELMDDLNAQLALLMPILEVPSANLGAIVAWIKALIATYALPQIAIITDLTLVVAEVGIITAKLSAKIATLGCTFIPPEINTPTVPPLPIIPTP